VLNIDIVIIGLIIESMDMVLTRVQSRYPRVWAVALYRTHAQDMQPNLYQQPFANPNSTRKKKGI
jgi:hypothetical protein